MPRIGGVGLETPTTDPRALLASAPALFAEHREARARLDRAELHLIVATWNAGATITDIRDWLGYQSRNPVRRALYAAEDRGELRRAMPPRLVAADDTGSIPTVEQG
jgi:hypothetical protein